MSFIKGMQKLHRQFDAIENQVLKRTLRGVLNKAGTPILSAAKREAPTKRWHLQKALAKRFWLNAKEKRAGVVIGVRDNYRAPNPDWKPGSGAPKTFFPKAYLHLVILGTAAHYTNMSKGKVRKRADGTSPMPKLIAAAAPNDFLGRAHKSSVAAAFAKMSVDVKSEIHKIAQKVGGPK